MLRLMLKLMMKLMRGRVLKLASQMLAKRMLDPMSVLVCWSRGWSRLLFSCLFCLWKIQSLVFNEGSAALCRSETDAALWHARPGARARRQFPPIPLDEISNVQGQARCLQRWQGAKTGHAHSLNIDNGIHSKQMRHWKQKHALMSLIGWGRW